MSTPEINIPACPECERLSKVADKSNELGDFLDFVLEEYTLCIWDANHNRWYSVYLGDSAKNQLLAKYFNIDLDKVEQERTALLKWLREMGEEDDD